MQLDKQSITEHLEKYVERMGSQNKAAHSMEGVSSATISQILNHKWQLINPAMWRKIAAQIEYRENTGWKTVNTRCFKKLMHILADAKENSLVIAGTAHAGAGKTQTINHFAAENHNTFVVRCSEFWNRKHFLVQVLKSMGREQRSGIIGDIYMDVVMELKQRDQPLLIFDEADKIPDQVLYFFITLYNELEEHCGMVFCATSFLKTRIERGLRLNKKGYEEYYSRIGRKLINLPALQFADVVQVCSANDVTDKKVIKDIWEDCEYDLRRVKRLIHAHKQSINNDLKSA